MQKKKNLQLCQTNDFKGKENLHYLLGLKICFENGTPVCGKFLLSKTRKDFAREERQLAPTTYNSLDNGADFGSKTAYDWLIPSDGVLKVTASPPLKKDHTH